MNLPEKRIDEHLRAVDFSGAVSIYSGREPLYSSAFGFRSIRDSIPNTTSTLFGMASGTKTLTAAGVLKLLEDGIIELSTTAQEFLGPEPGFIDGNATVEQLLNHTSGVFDYYDEELVEDFDNFSVEIPWCRLETPGDYLPLFEGRRMKFPAGQRASYSNGGYVLLGIMIEKVTGQLFRDYMEKEVFEPFGMVSTGFFPFNGLPGNTATGYMVRNGSRVSNIYQLPIRGAGDGGLYSSSQDMNAFWNNLFGDGPLSSGLVEKMTTEWVEIHSGTKYGLGVYIDEFQGYRALTASGCDCGVGFSSTFVPDISLNINIFSNITEGDRGVHSFIENELGSISN